MGIFGELADNGLCDCIAVVVVKSGKETIVKK